MPDGDNPDSLLFHAVDKPAWRNRHFSKGEIGKFR